jgi:hypothetical protein
MGREATRRQDRVEKREPESRLDRGGAEVNLDALEDRGERDQLAIRVEVDQFAGKALGAFGNREAVGEGRSNRIGAGNIPRALDVGGSSSRLVPAIAGFASLTRIC